MIKIYTDGSFKNGIVGFGAVTLIDDSEPIYLKGFEPASSDLAHYRNVAGECIAVFYALKGLERNSKITIYYDYFGVEKWATGEWNAKNDFTKWYQRQMKKAMEKYDISFVKVKAHSGDKWNERADQLAKEACEGI